MPDHVTLLVLAPLPDFLIDPLRGEYRCLDYFHAADKAALLREHAGDIRAMVGAGGTIVEKRMLQELPNLEIIAVFGVGYDGVPVEYCRDRGIKVTHTPEVLTEDVADTALALVLMTSRKLIAANQYLHSGKWKDAPFELATKPGGKRAGILGLGRIGKAIAERLIAIGMEIGYHGRRPQPGTGFQYFPSLNEMAAWCDFLVVSCPGGPATRHLVGRETLAALGRKGTLVNIARGSVVDEAALIEALDGQAIKAAGLDVFENEPIVPEALLRAESAVLLPHVGSGTRETRGAMGDLVIRNLRAHFAGQTPPTLVPEWRP